MLRQWCVTEPAKPLRAHDTISVRQGLMREASVTADHQNTKTHLIFKKSVSPFKKVAPSIYGVQITRNQELYLLRWVKNT
ncbi:hypothetical protein E2C01_030251 [Portunus trituberculatus]|uniref:Uncharacterized protein n=1 Tax=Portunus trituberculatus TaxID=210409 RepID=A0A5B7ERK9_PORTR|nr:hypothetical protein [Portunus trituberculatus]